MANYNLTGQKIKNTYGQLAQVNDSNLLVDGLGVASPIVTSSIINFSTEVSRSAADAGFGGGSSDWTEITNKPSGLVSSSAQVSYAGLSNIPSGIVSGAAQLPQIGINTSDISTLTAQTSSYLTSLPSGIVSGAAQLPQIGTNQTDISTLTAQTSSYLTSLPSGTISGSSQVDLSLASGTALTATSASYALTASYLEGGIPEAGLVAGVGSYSMKSSNALTEFTSSANGIKSIAFGNNANAPGAGGIAIGIDSRASGNQTSVAIGEGADSAGNDGAIAIGLTATAYGASNIAIGKGAGVTDVLDATICIGKDTEPSDSYGIAIGGGTHGGYQGVGIGYFARSSGYGVAIGAGATTSGADYAIAIGQNTFATGSEYQININNVIKYNYDGTNKTQIGNVLNLPVQATLPTGSVGDLAVSGSSLYFHNGTIWSSIS
jgi:trimeric autotransporter adhesin